MEFIKTIKNTAIFAYGTANFEVEVDEPHAAYTWLLDGKVVSQGKEYSCTFESGVHKVKCKAFFENTVAETDEVYVTVVDSPSVSLNSHEITTVETSPYKVIAQTTSCPNEAYDEFNWYVNGTKVDNNTNVLEGRIAITGKKDIVKLEVKRTIKDSKKTLSSWNSCTIQDIQKLHFTKSISSGAVYDFDLDKTFLSVEVSNADAPVDYYWVCDNKILPGSNSNVMSLKDLTLGEHKVYCRATVRGTQVFIQTSAVTIFVRKVTGKKWMKVSN